MLRSHFLYSRRTAVVHRLTQSVYAAAAHKFPALHGHRTVVATFCLHFTSRRGDRRNIFLSYNIFSSLKNPHKKTKEKFVFIFLRTWCDRRTLAIRLRQLNLAFVGII